MIKKEKRFVKLLFITLFISLFSFSCSLNIVKRRLSPPHPVKGGILFQFEAPSAKIVTLSGNFPDNMWSGTASSSKTFDPNIELMYDDGTHGDKVAGDGIWSLVKSLEPGRYQYKFVIDRNTWVKDPNCFETTDDGFGGQNSVLIVK
jgi:1,4-alpha-glucan branching enzyme